MVNLAPPPRGVASLTGQGPLARRRRAVPTGRKAGDAPWIWLVQVDAHGSEIRRLPTGMQLEGSSWSQVTCTFIADRAAAQFYIYAGAMPGAHPDNVGLGFWIDDL